MTDSVINKYYDTLLNLSTCNNAKKKELYLQYEEKFGKVDDVAAERNKEFIKNFIAAFESENQNGRLAIFFDVDFEKYIKEGNRYILANIYNTNDYNYKNEEDKIYGLPNNNMGLNSKKTYLENKTRKIEIPYSLAQKDVLKQKMFFDYLMNIFGQKKYYIYFTDNGIFAFGNKDYPKCTIDGYFMRIMKGQKECEILDFSTVKRRSDLIKVKVENYLNLQEENTQNLDYKTYTSLAEFIPVINKILYSNWLESNFFTDAKDIKIKDDSGKLKDIILNSRTAWVNWLYKGDKTVIKKIFNNVSLELIKNTIANFKIPKAREQYNLRLSIMNYFNKKENNMSEKIKNIVANLAAKIDSKENPEIETDEEFYFAIGQLANYFISLNKSNKKSHSLVTPILQCKNSSQLKSKLLDMFKKYNYAIEVNSLRFQNLYGMIARYETKTAVDSDMLIGGYLYKSLIYSKKGEQ